MIRGMNRWAAAVVLVAAAGAVTSGAAHGAGGGGNAGAGAAELRALVERYAPAVVAVKAVVKLEVQMGGQGRDQEQTLDLLGTVVDPSGLVMISNAQISSARLREMMTALGMADEGFDFTMTPTDFKVFFAGDLQGRPALLAAADTQLDLAFLQLVDPGETPLPAVDLTAAVEPEIGQEVVGVSRLNPSFDYAPYFEQARISGEVRKPRPSWILDGQFATLGLVAFTPAGKPVGVVSTVVSAVAGNGSGAGGGFGGIIASLGPRKTIGPVGVFLLPAAPVAKAIERSKERAAELLRERREAKVEAGEEAAPVTPVPPVPQP